jgi:hypothetical protein
MEQQGSIPTWFDGLGRSEQEKVLAFLYGPTLQRINLREGVFLGPAASVLGSGWEKKGLFLGPVPTQQTAVCPTCLRPY